MINIRPIEQSDWTAWHDLWTAYLAFYQTSLPDDTKRVAFDRLLDPSTKVHGLLAELDGSPVGLVHFIYHDHMWRPEGVCYLQDMFADPDIRGKGIGRALINAVYAAADAAGAPGVYWLTADSNTQARMLYDRVANLTPFIKYARV